jgi:hypothetical protein
MNNNNLPRLNDEGPGFERLLRRIDNDDRSLDHVAVGRNICILSDSGAQRLGRSMLRARRLVVVHYLVPSTFVPTT